MKLPDPEYPQNDEWPILAYVVRDPTFLTEHRGLRAELFDRQTLREFMQLVETYATKYGHPPDATTFERLVLKRPVQKAGLRDAMKCDLQTLLTLQLPERAYLADRTTTFIQAQTVARMAMTFAKVYEESKQTGTIDQTAIQRLVTSLTEVGTGTDHTERLDAINLGDVTPRPRTWLWERRIPAHTVTMLIGDPGIGKSRLTFDLLARLTRGLPWRDGRRTAPKVKAIVLTTEDDMAETMYPQIAAMGGDVDAVTVVRGVTGPRGRRLVYLDRDLALLEAKLDETGATVVFINPISSYFGKGDSNKAEDWRRIIDPLLELAGRRRVTILIVHHMTKNTDRKVLYRALGSIAVVAAVRSILAVVDDPRDATKRRRLFLTVLNKLTDTATVLAFWHDEQSISWESAPVNVPDIEALFQRATGRRDAPQRDAVMQFLRTVLGDGQEHPAEDVRAEAEAEGIDLNRTFQRAKEDLGVISTKSSFTGKWMWSLPPEETTEYPTEQADGALS